MLSLVKSHNQVHIIEKDLLFENKKPTHLLLNLA